MSICIANDDWFKNIDLSLDPQILNLSENGQSDYISNTMAVFRLKALNGSDDSRIDFSSDVWDLRHQFKRGEKAPNPVLHFENVPAEMKLHLKFFLNYYRNKDQVKVSTIYLRFAGIKSIIAEGILKTNKGVNSKAKFPHRST